MTSAPVEGTRPSDAERDSALAVLRDGAGSGRLSHDTFVRRMNFVLCAQSRGELADAIRDLPREEPRATRWKRQARTAWDSGVLQPWHAFLELLGGLPRTTDARKAVPAPGLALPAPGSPTVRIGRGPGATLRLADLSVSRFHAELRHVDHAWMLRDLGSMNGTEVNGLRITTAVRVRPGDHIRFGAVEYVLTSTE